MVFYSTSTLLIVSCQKCLAVSILCTYWTKWLCGSLIFCSVAHPCFLPCQNMQSKLSELLWLLNHSGIVNLYQPLLTSLFTLSLRLLRPINTWSQAGPKDSSKLDVELKKIKICCKYFRCFLPFPLHEIKVGSFKSFILVRNAMISKLLCHSLITYSSWLNWRELNVAQPATSKHVFMLLLFVTPLTFMKR